MLQQYVSQVVENENESEYQASGPINRPEFKTSMNGHLGQIMGNFYDWDIFFDMLDETKMEEITSKLVHHSIVLRH